MERDQRNSTLQFPNKLQSSNSRFQTPTSRDFPHFLKPVCNLKIEGPLKSTESYEAKNHITPLLEDTYIQKIIVNFRNVDQIDSSGIVWMVWAFRKGQQYQKQVIFCELNNQSNLINHLLRLNPYLNIYPTQSLALAALNTSSKEMCKLRESQERNNDDGFSLVADNLYRECKAF